MVSLTIPPLRDRREDIPLLITHLLGKMAGREPGRLPPAVAGDAMRRLMNHSWPGNVRELENALEHALVLSRGGAITESNLPPEVRQGSGPATRGLVNVPLHSEAEKTLLREALLSAGWNRSRAARRLGIDRTTLWRKIREYGLEPEE